MEERGEASKIFEEFNAWLETRTKGPVNALLMGTRLKVCKMLGLWV